MPPVGFEPTFSTDERPQTYTLDRGATETGDIKHLVLQNRLKEPRTAQAVQCLGHVLENRDSYFDVC